MADETAPETARTDPPADPPPGTATVTAKPPPKPAPEPPPPAPKPESVTVPYVEFQRFLETEREMVSRKAQDKERESEQVRIKTEAQIKAGQAEKAIATIRDQHKKELDDERAEKQTVKERSKRFARDKELAVASAGLPFTSPAAARQFLAIIGPQLEAHEEGDSFVVRTEDFKTPEQLLAAARADPEYAHFFLPTTKGGVKPGNTHAAPPTPPTAEPAEQPRNLGEAIVSQWQHNHPEGRLNAGFSRKPASRN